jgi:hypothetical protein
MHAATLLARRAKNCGAIKGVRFKDDYTRRLRESPPEFTRTQPLQTTSHRPENTAPTGFSIAFLLT